MTTQALEKTLRTLEEPVEGALLKWLYLHLPPRPITSKKAHGAYARAVSILMRELELGDISEDDRRSIEAYLQAATPFIEEYEKKESPLKQTTPEDMLRFLMEQNDLSQYDLASELGGQPVVSDCPPTQAGLGWSETRMLTRLDQSLIPPRPQPF